jgi:putative two-component system hydrogenase maturation factor HypX/HoxX
VLNPYYQHMGGLYGSEYWTYLLPRRVGAELAAELTSAPFNPIGTRRAVEIGLLDATFGDTIASFRAQVQGLAERLARHPDVSNWLEQKRQERARDEQIKPLAAYRTEEMAKSHECFFGQDRSYHLARSLFVHKTGAPCTVQIAAAPSRDEHLTEAQRAVTKVREAQRAVTKVRKAPPSGAAGPINPAKTSVAR